MEEKSLFDHDLSEIVNVNEELVIELMEIVFDEDQTLCRCPVCIEDIYALALNQLKPLYVQITFKEKASKNTELTKRIDMAHVEKIVRAAVGKVSKNPYH
jgi:competence protein ComFB